MSNVKELDATAKEQCVAIMLPDPGHTLPRRRLTPPALLLSTESEENTQSASSRVSVSIIEEARAAVMWDSSAAPCLQNID